MKVLILIVTLLTSYAPVQADELHIATLGRCTLESGASIEACEIGYRVIGERNAAGDNVILFPTWFGGTSEALVPIIKGGFVDTSKYQVVLIDALANGVSSSPSNNAAADGAFPVVTIQDMVDTQHRLATQVLGVTHVHAVMGISMGGMQTYEWGVRYPQFMDRLIPIIGSPRLGSYDIALWHTHASAQSMFRDCQCDTAVEIIAGLGVLIGSTRDKVLADTARGAVVADIAASATARALTVSGSWNTTRQLEAMMAHDISNDVDGSMAGAAEVLRAPLLSIVAGTDHVVVPEPAITFSEIDKSEVVVLNSDCGHGAVGCESAQVSAAIAAFLD
ncbi:MAG: alpha/beta fold hydrolase [Pseudomonadota bacterium]